MDRVTHRRRAAWLLAVLLVTAAARAGLDPLHTLVVVNDQDAGSLAVGRHYATAHGIPDSLLLHVSLPPADTISLSVYTNQLDRPLRQYLADTGLEPQVRQVALAWMRPFRVQLSGDNMNGITSCLFYGYRDAPPPGVCELNPLAANPLFASGRRFVPAEHARRLYPAFLVTAGTPAQTAAMVERAAGATFARPAGTVHLIRTFDPYRNVQWPQFDRADFLGRFSGAPVAWQAYDAPAFSNLVAVAGVMAGAESHQPQLGACQFTPGALGDHLTSFGGYLPGFPPQMSALDWLRAGCAASWGTVIEPCNYTNKFPVAELHAWYQRGFSAGEAYTMAVSHPYQGVAVGDPLCAPYADPVSVSLSGLASNATVAGTVAVTAQAASSVAGRRLRAIDWFVDDRWDSTSAPAAPAPGNQLTASLGGTNFTYTVQAGDDLYGCAAGLAAAIDPAAAFTAEALADLVMVRQAVAGAPGAPISVAASSAAGTAAVLAVSAHAVTHHLLESRYRARATLQAQGAPVAGLSQLRLDLTRLDGVQLVKQVTAQSGESRHGLMLRMLQAVEADPAFNHPDGALATYIEDYPGALVTRGTLFSVDRTWRAANLRFRWRVSGVGLLPQDYGGPLNDNADVLAGRAGIRVEAGETNLVRTFLLDTTALADGPHTLRAVAWEGTAVETPGSAGIPFLVDNHDLSCALAWPGDGAWILQGSLVTGVVQAAGSSPVVETRLWAEGKDLGGLVWDSAGHAPGWVNLQARVRDALGRRAWSLMLPVRLLADDDRDGMADEWEILHFGGLMALPGADADGDGVTNREEFIADTSPVAAGSRLRLEIDRQAGGGRRLTFPASVERRYQVETAPGFPPLWSPVFPADTAGAGAPFQWLDGSPGTSRLYRVRARLP